MFPEVALLPRPVCPIHNSFFFFSEILFFADGWIIFYVSRLKWSDILEQTVVHNRYLIAYLLFSSDIFQNLKSHKLGCKFIYFQKK